MSSTEEAPKNFNEAIDMTIAIHKKLGFTPEEVHEISRSVEYYFKFLVTERMLEKSQAILAQREKEKTDLIIPNDPFEKDPE